MILTPQAPVRDAFAEIDPLHRWPIIATRDGPGDGGLPVWVTLSFLGEVFALEELPAFADRYVFVARNHADDLGVLSQWARNFSTRRDLAGLVVRRVERRFVADALLYPDDEYGEFFIRVIRGIWRGDPPAAAVEGSFWVQRQRPPDEEEDDEWETGMEGAAAERFEYLLLVSVDRDELMEWIFDIMDAVEPSIPPTREQAAAIAGIRQTFFEGF